MPEKYDPNALWVALSEYGEGNLFSVYPKLLAQILLDEEAAREEGDTSEAENLVLPSDKEWRLQQYFHLVALQKDLEDVSSDDESTKGQTKREIPEVWAPWRLVVSIRNPRAPAPVAIRTPSGPGWDIAKVIKAGRLLCKPPMKVDFEDEQEMRLVYSLIYDVFRYKSILDQTIEDVEFFEDFPQYSDYRNLVWLFVMELARRRWRGRSRAEMEQATQLLNAAGKPFMEIEKAIWKQRVHFAAAIARIRIKNRAFSLSELLPPHLREERITACVNKETVTGWVNTFKAKKLAELVEHLNDLGFSYCGSKYLHAGEYRFDRVCPRFITLRPLENMSIGKLDLVKDGVIVLQEREFCEGASTLCRAIRVNSIRGVVAQTHASSPRCSAYLAAQLKELAAVVKAQTPAAPATPELGKLVVFGAGDKVESYVATLRDMGIEASQATQSDAPVCVISDAVHCETPAVINALEGVVAVLATPPNSYSAVTDPIDLVCGRGGDLAMLEILTESEVDCGGKDRVQGILEEQKKTLKVLLSKPQIQLILYETHSALEAENQAQVTRAVSEANRLARERHALLKKKQHHKPRPETATTETADSMTEDTHRSETAEQLKDKKSQPGESRPNSGVATSKTRTLSGNSVLTKSNDDKVPKSRPETNKARPIPKDKAEQYPRDPDEDYADIVVPNCDLFEVHKLPTLGNGLNINYILDRDGCYLGLIQRKEITHLDAKYMIRVAEERGLFGGGAPAPVKHKRKEIHTNAPKRRKRKNSFEVERIAAPTYSSRSRAARRGSAPPNMEGCDPDTSAQIYPICSKHARRQAAAASIFHARCTCDAKHRAVSRRASVDRHVTSPAPPPGPHCRQPFPLVVTDLKFKTMLHDRNIHSAAM